MFQDRIRIEGREFAPDEDIRVFPGLQGTDPLIHVQHPGGVAGHHGQGPHRIHAAADGFEAAVHKARALGPDSSYSHFRALALAFEGMGDRRAAPVLKSLLGLPGVGGHSMTAAAGPMARIPGYERFTTRNLGIGDKERSDCLRELCLARALYRLGDADGLGERILRAYSADPRRAYANHASLVLGTVAK